MEKKIHTATFTACSNSSKQLVWTFSSAENGFIHLSPDCPQGQTPHSECQAGAAQKSPWYRPLFLKKADAPHSEKGFGG